MLKLNKTSFLYPPAKDFGMGWCVIAGFVVLFVAVWLVTVAFGVGPNMLLRALNASDAVRAWVGWTVARGGMLVSTFWLSAWMLKKIVGLQAEETILARYPGWHADLLAGLLLGTLAMGALFVFETQMGWLVVEGWRLSGQPLAFWLRTAWLAFLSNLLAAVGEEVMFRGYFQTGLQRAWGTLAALLVMSIPFGAAHLLVSGASETHWALFIVLLTLPGIMLGIAYLRSGTLWLPMGIHFTWNLFQTDLLNLTADPSGETLFGLATRQTGPAWFVGTSYGIETGVAGLVGLGITLLGVWLWTGRKNTRQEYSAPSSI